MSLFMPPQRGTLMVGMSSKNYRIGDTVKKECHVLVDDHLITKENAKACKVEADVYRILGSHPPIAECLSIGLEKIYFELKYYPNGKLKDYIYRNLANITELNLKRWAQQMIESVGFIHSKGVKYSDLRLDQWLVDADLNTRLSDFNASGYDDQPDLRLKGFPAQGREVPSHCLPQKFEADNTVESDLFALGSTLYDLVTGQIPYQGLSSDSIESLFEERNYPSTEGLLLSDIIMGSWKQKYPSAKDILHDIGEGRCVRSGEVEARLTS